MIRVVAWIAIPMMTATPSGRRSGQQIVVRAPMVPTPAAPVHALAGLGNGLIQSVRMPGTVLTMVSSDSSAFIPAASSACSFVPSVILMCLAEWARRGGAPNRALGGVSEYAVPSSQKQVMGANQGTVREDDKMNYELLALIVGFMSLAFIMNRNTVTLMGHMEQMRKETTSAWRSSGRTQISASRRSARRPVSASRACARR